MIAEYHERVPEEEWPNWVLGNHDQHRVASRCGPHQARVAAMPHAGFTTGEPWLPIADDFRTKNVKALADDPRSTLTLYKRLIGLQHERKTLSVGRYKRVVCEGDVLTYERNHGKERFLVALNVGDAPARPTAP